MTEQPLVPEVLRCSACGRPAPLTLDAHVSCLHCGSDVPFPPQYRERALALREVDQSRAATEATWLRLSHGDSGRLRYVAFALTAALPPVAVIVVKSFEPAVSGLPLLGQFALPAIAPGALMFGYGATASSLRRSFDEALGATNVEGSMHCRQCGAPLDTVRHEVSATCLYCGTDNLLSGTVRAAKHQARTALRTLADAVADLRTRRRLEFAVSVVIALALIGLGLSLTQLATLTP